MFVGIDLVEEGRKRKMKLRMKKGNRKRKMERRTKKERRKRKIKRRTKEGKRKRKEKRRKHQVVCHLTIARVSYLLDLPYALLTIASI